MTTRTKLSHVISSECSICSGAHMYLLSLSRWRMSSLNVSLFFSSVPLTSYTTCTTGGEGAEVQPQEGEELLYTNDTAAERSVTSPA